MDKSVGKEIRIDPTYARGGAASFFFDEVNFIPLETTKNSFFGQIDKLIVTKEFYIILDRETDAILIFKKNGAFYTKIVRIPGITKKREEWQAKPFNIFNNFCPTKIGFKNDVKGYRLKNRCFKFGGSAPVFYVAKAKDALCVFLHAL